MTHRGPFQPRTFCDSVIFSITTSPLPVTEHRQTQQWPAAAERPQRDHMLSSEAACLHDCLLVTGQMSEPVSYALRPPDSLLRVLSAEGLPAYSL